MPRKLYDGHGKGSKSRLFSLYPYAYCEGVRDGQREIGGVGLVGIDESSEFTEAQMEYLLRRTENRIVDMIKYGSALGIPYSWWDEPKTEGR